MNPLDRLVEQGEAMAAVPLGPMTTYKLGGSARWLAEVGDRDRMARVVPAWRDSGVPLLVLGRGSNLVVADGGFDGLVVRLVGEFTRIEHHDDRVSAGAAVPLPVLARSAVAAGRLGLEFMVGIPGSVGGAVRQNAGCHGSETVDRLERAVVVDFLTGAECVRGPSELELGYRHSSLASTDVVLEAEFTFVVGDPRSGESTMREITRWRRENQPGGTLNAGSVFKNPDGDSAGRIIDSLGLKGLAVGAASISTRHANFLVAAPGATAAEVRRLVCLIQTEVEARTGLRLEPEIQFVGNFEE